MGTKIRDFISKSTPQHAQGIHAIEKESLSDPWSVESILYEINNKHSICFVALLDNNNIDTVIGHVTMRHIINEGHINNIVVGLNYRRRGVASLLMETLIQEARVREMIGLTLEVRVGNKAALSLYNNFGFVVEGHRKNYYSHPNEDAAIMWKEFKDGAK